MTITLGSTVTVEGALLGVAHIVASVTDISTDNTDTFTTHQPTCAAVVPFLHHVLLLGDGDGAELFVGLCFHLVRNTWTL